MNMHIFCMNTFGKGSIEGENSKCHQTRLHGGISVLVSLKTCYFTITYTKAPVFIIKQCIAICLAKVPPEATVFLALRPVPVSASLWIYYRYFCNICGSRTDFFHNASLSVLYTMCYLSIRTRIIIIIMFIKQS